MYPYEIRIFKFYAPRKEAARIERKKARQFKNKLSTDTALYTNQKTKRESTVPTLPPNKAGEAPRIESRAVIETRREAPLPKPGEKSQTKFKNLPNSCIIGL
jgi:hypothetical protein